ncbi:hypothetical protein [Vibrio sp. SCSIO 43136]|uniref:hypothetical protein n=1 Tax=Vibrio sp. SCSIO 43136 TaxID=2819101 RepID=UPI002075FB17|nr:hypothetical protein [Vibrio sp. SCSIO 43136]USD67035.1 hypothetical protein J4N39_20580 [Vibrio sp. SCSIO 43136]
MKEKILQALDSTVLSIFNFLVTFASLKYLGQDYVVYYGISMTVTLIFLSLYRCVFLIPINNQTIISVSSDILSTVSLYISSVAIVIGLLIIVLCETYSFVTYMLVFLYIFLHENLKYISPVISNKSTINISSFTVLFFTFLLILFSAFSFDNLFFVLMLCITIDVIVMCKYCSVYSFRNVLETFFTDKIAVVHRIYQSTSQLFIVHVPFLISPYLYSSSIVSSMFVARSIYQPTQIIIKSLELVDQRDLSLCKLKNSYKLVGFRYLLISLLLTTTCFWFGSLIMGVFYLPSEIPTKLTLAVWGGVFIMLSVCRSRELVLLKLGSLNLINRSYFLGTLSLLVSFSLVFIGDSFIMINPSIVVLISWVVVAVSLTFQQARIVNEQFQ